MVAGVEKAGKGELASKTVGVEKETRVGELEQENWRRLVWRFF